VNPKRLYIVEPGRSSLLFGALLCLIVGLSLVLMIISPGW